ncbi:MAG: type II toxin-antitoxin system RelE/ParE family toxin [Sphingomonadales bacterium]|nr:type II toxin-antitoxin system RelE/ParE family toxin [Sphingomonadales bacterium]
MTTYRLVFDDRALGEFRKLDPTLQNQARKKLRERLEHPRVEADRLAKFPDCYKIKLRQAGYRLIYQVRDNEIIIVVIAVGKRDSNKRDVYSTIKDRLAP